MTKDVLQSGRLYKLSTGSKTVEYYHYFCLLFSRSRKSFANQMKGRVLSHGYIIS